MSVPLTEVIVWVEHREVARHILRPGRHVFGRSRDCSICIEASLISREQARLTVGEDGSLLLEDLGSTNGTFLDGERISGPVRVLANQTIQIGVAQVVVQQKSGVAEPDNVLPAELFAATRYEPGSEIAKGGMGVVLSARQPSLRREVALKVMLQPTSVHDRLRFVEEAQITGQLEHPNIVPVHELAVDESGLPYYTMKLVKGITLKKILELLRNNLPETAAKYPLAALLTIFQKVCDAVSFAHSKGVIHRDLKPANIMVGDYGEVLVADWGIAKIMGKNSSENTAAPLQPNGDAITNIILSARHDHDDVFATIDGAVIGTPRYMSPEQARGEIATLDPRSDIFSLGAILYELVTLSPPFPGKTATEVLASIKRGTFLLPNAYFRTFKMQRPQHLPSSGIPDSLEAVIAKALTTERRHRYQRVADFQADLTAYQNGFATSAENAGPWRQFKLLVARNRALSTAVATGLLLIATLTAAFTVRLIAERNQTALERDRAEAALASAESEKERAGSALAKAQGEQQIAENALGKAESERQRAEKALIDFKAAQSLAQTEHNRADKAVGDVQTQSHRAEAALADLKKTAPTFLKLAQARLAEGNFAEAFEQIGYAIRLDETSPDYFLFRAQAYQSAHIYAEAISDYQRVLAMSPGDKVAAANLNVCNRLKAGELSPAMGTTVGLISWWKADGNALDSIGRNHGSLLNGATFQAGRFGQAFGFDGKAGYVSIPWSPDFAIDGNDFTIALWINLSALLGEQAFLSSEGDNKKWAFQFVPGHFQLVITPARSPTKLESTYFGLTTDRWYHVALVRERDTLHFYVDGAKISSEAWTGKLPATSAPLSLGHAAGRFYFSGRLDDLRLYARCLSPAEVSALTAPPAVERAGEPQK